MKELFLKELHLELGAKLVPFAGWNMPVQYQGITPEHNVVRNSAGIFDVSHMGQLMVEGEKAREFLDYVSTNNLSKMVIGKAQYGMLLNPQGGVIDDIINYKITENKFFVCVNASNTDEDYNWLLKQAGEVDFGELKISNLSDAYSQFAIQGPKAMSVLNEFFGEVLKDLKRFSFVIDDKFSAAGIPCIIARTGYSGEDGCEVFLSKEYAELVWRGLFEAAERLKIEFMPCGLGARDTLRLEACFPLHGHEIRPDITPLSAKLDRFVDLGKNFIGNSALQHQRNFGVSPVLVGLKVQGKGLIRADYPVVVNDRTVGWVTSGTMTPTVGEAIGLALVLPDFSKLESVLGVKVRDKILPVQIVDTPFYKKS